MDEAEEPPLTDRERMEAELIRGLISSYFHIVRESIQDLVPKSIMHLLVNHCKEVPVLQHSGANCLGSADSTRSGSLQRGAVQRASL